MLEHQDGKLYQAHLDVQVLSTSTHTDIIGN